MTEFDLDRFLPYQLAVLAGRTSRDFGAIYAERFGLSIPEWRVMAHLNRRDRQSVRDIHHRAEMEKSKVTRAAQRLVERGLVEKAASDTDGRLVALTLTRAGRAMMAEIAPLALDFEASVTATIPEADAAAFRRVVSHLLERK